MNKKLIRLVALMLVAVMLLFCVACAETPAGDETTAGQPDDSNNPSGESNSGNKNPDDPSGTTGKIAQTTEPTTVPKMEYDNEVTVLYWSDVEMPEFEMEKPSINGVENAIYKRNIATVAYLGLEKLSWVGVDGDHGEKANFAEHVGNSYIAGDRKYDIIATYSRTAGICAIEGYLTDLNAIEDSHINLDNKWWPPALTENVVIDDSIYFLSGDISTNVLHMMYAIFCNTDMANELRLANPVDLVLNKEWTLDKFKGMIEGVFSEQNGDDKPTAGDRFGFLTEQLHVDAFYAGAGLRMIVEDEDKVLAISSDFTGNKLTLLINDLSTFFHTTDVRIAGGSATQFSDGNSLFTQNRMYLADHHLKDVEFKYACLPTPMYDEKQDGYYTTIGNPFTLWGIMKDVENDQQMLLECTAVMETLAYEAYRNTTPQIFEVNMKVKYSDIDNPDTVRCFDYIREGCVFDLGRIFPDTEMGGYMNEYVSRAIVGSTDWASVKATNVGVLRSNLRRVVSKFESQKK